MYNLSCFPFVKLDGSSLADYVEGRFDWEKIVQLVKDDFDQLYSLLTTLEKAKSDYTTSSGKLSVFFIYKFNVLD